MSLSFSKEYYINHLKELLKNNNVNTNVEVIGEGYYEWEINDWDKIKDIVEYEFSPEFEISGYHWRVFVYPNGKGDDNNQFLSYFLFNSDVKKDHTLNILTYFVLCIHNYNNYSCFNSKRSSSPDYFDKNTCVMGFSKYIKKSDLYNKNENSNCSLIENNKVVFGVYLQIYNKKNDILGSLNNLNINEKKKEIIQNKRLLEKKKNIQNDKLLEKKEDIQNRKILEKEKDQEKEQKQEQKQEQEQEQENMQNKKILKKKEIEYEKNKKKIYYKESEKWQFINTLKSLVNEDNIEKEIINGEDYYEWKIDNWDEIKNNRTATSPEFIICGYNWRILLYPNGKDNESKDYISFFLLNSDVKKTPSLKIFNYFVSYIRNYKDYSCINSKKSQSPDYFDKNTWTMGFSKFIKKDDLYNNSNKFSKPFIENNKVIVGVYIRIYSNEKNQQYHPVYPRILPDESQECQSYSMPQPKINSQPNQFYNQLYEQTYPQTYLQMNGLVNPNLPPQKQSNCPSFPQSNNDMNNNQPYFQSYLQSNPQRYPQPEQPPYPQIYSQQQQHHQYQHQFNQPQQIYPQTYPQQYPQQSYLPFYSQQYSQQYPQQLLHLNQQQNQNQQGQQKIQQNNQSNSQQNPPLNQQQNQQPYLQ